MTVIIDNAIPDLALSISELTEASLDGNGVLDVLLKTMRLHLQREFEANRITGVAYATAYTESMSIFLQQAVQYSLAKSKLSLELQQMQEQVKLLQLQQDQTIAQTNKIATDTAVAIKQGLLIDAQTCEVQASTNRINAEVGLKLPVEIDNMKKQGVLIATQTSEVTYRIQNTLPAEVEHTYAQVHQIQYTTENILPAQKTKLLAEIDLTVSQDDLAEFNVQYKAPIEKQILEKQRDQLTAQTANVVAQTSRTEFETLNVLPSQVANQTKQTELLTYELTSLKPQELALKIKQVALTDYELTQLKPKELELAERNIVLAERQADVQEAQGLLYTQKSVTEKAQTDNTVVGTGSIIDRQNQMMQAQADGFKRDAEQKVAKILIDTWSVRHNGDPDANPVDTINKLADSNIGAAVQKMLNGVGA